MDTQQFQVLQRKVNKAKLELSLWEKDFKKKHHRKVQYDDVANSSMAPKYKEYNKLKKELAVAKAELGVQSSQELSPDQEATSSQTTVADKSERKPLGDVNTRSSTDNIPSSPSTEYPSTHTSSQHSQTSSITDSKDVTKNNATTTATTSNSEKDENSSTTKKKPRTLILNGYNKEKAALLRQQTPKIIRQMNEKKKRRRQELLDFGRRSEKEKEEQQQQQASQSSQQSSQQQQYSSSQLGRSRSFLSPPPISQEFLDMDSEDDDDLGFSIEEDRRPAPSWNNNASFEFSENVKLKIEKGTLGEICEFNKQLEANLSEDLRLFIEEHGLQHYIAPQTPDNINQAEDSNNDTTTNNNSENQKPTVPVYKKRPPKRQTRLRKLRFVEA